MYKIILSNSIVVGASDNLQYLENGLVAVSDFKRYAKTAYDEIIEVSDIPTDYEDYKYKYDEISGFTINENWVEPEQPISIRSLIESNESLQNTVERQEQQLQEQAGAIAELTTLISTMNV